jgi:hypothetical protein
MLFKSDAVSGLVTWVTKVVKKVVKQKGWYEIKINHVGFAGDGLVWPVG